MFWQMTLFSLHVARSPLIEHSGFIKRKKGATCCFRHILTQSSIRAVLEVKNSELNQLSSKQCSTPLHLRMNGATSYITDSRYQGPAHSPTWNNLQPWSRGADVHWPTEIDPQRLTCIIEAVWMGFNVTNVLRRKKKKKKKGLRCGKVQWQAGNELQKWTFLQIGASEL